MIQETDVCNGKRGSAPLDLKGERFPAPARAAADRYFHRDLNIYIYMVAAVPVVSSPGLCLPSVAELPLMFPLGSESWDL